jgi:hypothetical protein
MKRDEISSSHFFLLGDGPNVRDKHKEFKISSSKKIID